MDDEQSTKSLIDRSYDFFKKICRYYDLLMIFGSYVLTYLMTTISLVMFWFTLADFIVHDVVKEHSSNHPKFYLCNITVMALGSVITFSIFFVQHSWYNSVFLHTSTWVTGLRAIGLIILHWKKLPRWARVVGLGLSIMLMQIFFRKLLPLVKRERERERESLKKNAQEDEVD